LSKVAVIVGLDATDPKAGRVGDMLSLTVHIFCRLSPRLRALTLRSKVDGIRQ